MNETLEIKQYYVWDVTALRGIPEIYLTQNEILVFFESGRTVNLEDFGQQLSKITEEEYNNTVKTTTSVEFSTDNYSNIPLGNPTESLQEISQIEQNPIQIILDKQKKLEETSIALNITLNLPSKKVVEFLTMMFEEEEVFSTISQFSLNQLDDNSIKELIKIAILNNYTNVS